MTLLRVRPRMKQQLFGEPPSTVHTTSYHFPTCI